MIPKAILLPIARCSGVAFAIRSCDFGSSRTWLSTTCCMPTFVTTAKKKMYVKIAPIISGSHQLLFPRLMSTNVFEGAVNVFVTRCHWLRPGPSVSPVATASI